MKWVEIHEHSHSTVNHILRTVNGKHKWLRIPTVSARTMKKSKDFHVIGYLGNYTTDAACDQVVVNSSLSLKILPMKPKWSISHRYIYVGNHEYVGVPRYAWLILVPIVTAVGICFVPNSGLPSALKDVADGIPFSSVDNGDNASSDNDSISFYGYTEQYVSSDKSTITLGNPSNNDVYFGAGLGIWGVVNLMEGYGNDNPGAKSQGMKHVIPDLLEQ